MKSRTVHGRVIFIIVFFIIFFSQLDSVTNLELYEALIPSIESSDEETILVKSPDITCFISHDGDALAKLNASEEFRKNAYNMTIHGVSKIVCIDT